MRRQEKDEALWVARTVIEKALVRLVDWQREELQAQANALKAGDKQTASKHYAKLAKYKLLADDLRNELEEIKKKEA